MTTWSPSTALILSLSGGAIYAINDAHSNGGKNVAKIMVASAIVGFVATAIDDVTNGPTGTALMALYLFAAIINKGAPAFLAVTKVASNVKTPAANPHP